MDGIRFRCRARSACRLLLLACILGVPVWAAAQDADGDNDASQGGYLDYLNTPHRWFSRRLGNLSRQIDSYFGTPDLYNEVSGSYAEIRLQQQFAQSGGGPGADFRIKIDLPHTEDRFKLLFESVPEENDPRDDNPVSARRAQDNAPSSGLFAGLRRVFARTAGFQFSTDAGIKLHLPPRAFARARLRRNWSLGHWQLRFKETLFWFNSEGAGETTEFDLDRRLGKRFALRASTRYQWLDDTDELSLGHGLALYQLLDPRNSLAYELGFQASNRPTLRSEQYRVGLRFRRRVHEDWLFLSVVPDVVWRREEGFSAEPGVLIQLEMLFGERYLGTHYKPPPKPRPPHHPPGMIALDRSPSGR